MSKRIQHERAVELAGEGWRYFDLKRWNLWNLSKDYIEKSITGDNLVTRGYQSRHKLWPIPGQEIEMNPALHHKIKIGNYENLLNPTIFP
jgi:hypothetical protein